MNAYEISFNEYRRDAYPPIKRTVVAESVEAKNGIDAIRSALAARFAGDADLEAALAEGRSLGSNKRLVVAGITFEANKV